MAKVDDYKESISDRYIQDFKKEIGFFDKIMLTPIFTKMKKILKSDKKIDVDNLGDLEDLGSWRKVLGVKIGDKKLFDNLVNKTFNFLKEKQGKIIQAQTEGRLDELLNLVVNGKLDVLEQGVNNPSRKEEDNEQREESRKEEDNEQREESRKEGDSEQREESRKEEDNEQREESSEQKREGNKEKGESSEENEGTNPITAGVEAGIITATTYGIGISEVEKKMGLKLKETKEEFDAQETKRTLNSLIEQMDEKLQSGVKMNRAQENVYRQSINEFKKAAESLDGETAEAFKAWQKLQNKVDPRLLKTFKGNIKVLNLIDALPDEELATIIGKSEREIIEFFNARNITVGKDIARQLGVLNSVGEIKGFTRILRNGTKLARFLRGLKGMGVVSFLFAGVDVWCYFDNMKEAELASKVNELRGEILKNNANVQLIIGLGSIGLEILALAAICAAGGSVTGPIGTTIGIAIGLLAGAVTIGYDELYGNKKEFYAQNRYDFINQKRTKIKQSIVQLFESDRLDMNEGMKESIKDDRGPNPEIDTMEDAWEALIYQEEIMEGGFETLQRYYSSGESEESFKNTLNDEGKKKYEEEKESMERIINLRMEYIKKYVKEDKSSPEYDEMRKAVMSLRGMEYVEQLLANSKIYSYLKTDHEDAYVSNYRELDIEGYKEAYKNKLLNEYKSEFDMFEKLRESNPSLLREICEGTLASKSSLKSKFDNIKTEKTGDEKMEVENSSPTYSADEIKILEKNIDFIEKYNEYLNIALPIEKRINTGVSYNTDYAYIEKVLLDLNYIYKRPIRDEERSIRYLSCEFSGDLSNVDSQVSNCTFQNVLYSIAKEIHGYTGSNDMFELAGFFTGDGDNTGIYMHDGFRISDDHGFWFFGAKDDKIDIRKVTKDQAIKMIVKEVDLDSPVECADESLTEEFRKRVKEIIEREYGYKDKKGEYEEEIVNFIKTNNCDQNGYVQLPTYLAICAKKAGIGDVNKFLFRVENGQIYALSRGDMANNVLCFDNDKNIKYEFTNMTGKELTPKEKELINYVDEMENKINKLRSKQGHFMFWSEHEDDLDIPIELENAISQKSIERKNIKEGLLYMQPSISQECLTEKSEEYYRYFNGLYLGLLNAVTGMTSYASLNSNDINDSEHFFQAANFISINNIVTIKEGKIEINNLVHESIRKHLPELFDLYKDKDTGKKVKELLLDEENADNQKRGQEIAKKICELCLEQAVLEFDDSGNVTNIDVKDFSDEDLEEVKNKLNNEIKGIGFSKVQSEYRHSDVSWESKFSKRQVEQAEVDIHSEIHDLTQKIINIMEDVDRAGKRGTPKFVADEIQKEDGKISGVFQSWGYDEKISIILNGNNIEKIRIDGLDKSFDDIEEGLRTANLINYIKNNIKENPYGKEATDRTWGTYGYFHRSSGGDLERDIVNNISDINILDASNLQRYYPMIWEDKGFLGYINGFVK